MRLKMKRILGLVLSLALVLGMLPSMSLTAYAATTKTVTINKSDLDENAKSITKDVVTFSYDDMVVVGPNTGLTGVAFATSIGNFTKIEITASETRDFDSSWEITGDRHTGNKATWTGSAATVNGGTVTAVANADIVIVCTIEEQSNVDVTSVSLNPSTAQTIDVDEKVSFTATVSPDNATDKTVKWSVGGTDAGAVKLYSGEACTTEVGTAATSTLTVYAKGISAGSATVTATSNADSTKSASCTVTVTAATTYPLYVGGTQVTSANASNITGGDTATASYDATTNTLTLNNYVSSECPDLDSWRYGICYKGTDALNISIKGENAITATEEPTSSNKTIGIFSTADTTISGTGSLTVTSRDHGIIAQGSKLDIKSGTLTVESSKAYALDGKVSIDSTVTGITLTGGIDSYNSSDIDAINPDVNVTNAIAGTGWTNRAGTEGQTEIAVSTEGQKLSGYKKVQFPAAHTHEFKYSASGATITATCSADGCTLPPSTEGGTDHVATLTIVKPTLTTYGQTGEGISAEATISDTYSIKGDAAVSYYNATKSGNTYTKTGNALSAAPTDAGDYVAEITLVSGDNSATASVGYTIAKATLTNVSVVQNGTLTYTSSAQTPQVTTAATAVNDQAVTFTYSKSQDGTYGSMPTVTKVSDCGTFYYKATAPNHNDTTGSFEVTMQKGEAPEVVVPTLTPVTYDPAKTLSNITLTEGWTWEDGTIVPTVGNSGYKASLNIDDANYDYSSVDGYNSTTHKVDRTLSLTVNKADPTVTAPTAKTDLTYTGSAQTLISAGTATGGTMYYALGTDATTAPTEGWNENATTITGINAGTYYVWYKVTGDSNHNNKAAACVTVTISKASSSATVTGKTLTYTGSAQELVSATNVVGGTVLYSLTGADATDFAEGVPAKTDAGTYTVWWKIAESANYNGSNGSVTASIGTKAMIVSATGYEAAYDESAHGITVTVTEPTGATVKYGTTAGSCTQTSSPTYTDAGSYTVYYKVTADNYADFTGSAVVKITKASNSVSAPTIAGWTEGDAASTPGGSAATFGTPVYKYSTSADGTYTATQPAAAGTYYCRAEVAGTDNYAGAVSTAVSFTITAKSSAATQVSNHVSTGTLSAAQVQAISAAGYKTVIIDSGVKKINKKAFAGTNIKTVVIKSKKLTKKRVKNAFKGSKVTKVRVKVSRKKSVNNKYLKKYKRLFTKKNCGRKVTVKK